MGHPKVFRGIGASPGVAIGQVFLLDRGPVRIPRYHIVPQQIEPEILRLGIALKTSVIQISQIRHHFEHTGGTEHQAIIEAHEMMLRDKSWLDEANQLIRHELLCPEWAVSQVFARIRKLFDNIDDAYFRERRGDIDFVGERIIRNLVGQHTELSDLDNLGDACVIIARDLSPIDTSLLNRQKVLAFVTEAGGRTSHTSIIARSLEVPAVVGAQGIFNTAGNGDLIVVDGLEGAVMLRPSRAQLDRGKKRAEHFRRTTHSLLQAKALPAQTLDGQHLSIAGNIEHPHEVDLVLSRGGEAIGLYRTEFLYTDPSNPPTEADHFAAYCRIFERTGDRLVTIRTLDLGGDKVVFRHHDDEANPALGLRAIRYALKNPTLLSTQLTALLRASVYGNMRIMVPMITCLQELLQVRAIFSQVQQALQQRGEAFRKDVPLGIMIEVPSAAYTVDILAKHADFCSIGTNDLLQYLLAIDRTNERVAYLYEPLHPAVLRTLQHVANAAKAANIPVSICGEMAGETEFLPVLLGLGFTQLSMNAGSIPTAKHLIRNVDLKTCQALTQKVLQTTDAQQAATLVRNFMQQHATLTHVFNRDFL